MAKKQKHKVFKALQSLGIELPQIQKFGKGERIGTTLSGKAVYNNLIRKRKDHVRHALEVYPAFTAEDHYNAARDHKHSDNEYAYRAHGDAARHLQKLAD